jgi:hypothetical protein
MALSPAAARLQVAPQADPPGGDGSPGARLVAGRQLAHRVGLPGGVARERGGHRRPPRGGGRQLVGDARQVARVARAQLAALRRPAPRARARPSAPAQLRAALRPSVQLRTAPCSSTPLNYDVAGHESGHLPSAPSLAGP